MIELVDNVKKTQSGSNINVNIDIQHNSIRSNSQNHNYNDSFASMLENFANFPINRIS